MENLHRKHGGSPQASQRTETETGMAANAVPGMEQRGGDKAAGDALVKNLACPACEDSGECGRCEGNGKIFNEDEALPPWSICGDCQGSGLCFECDE
jgi:DnaJ-class molecular chaperone